MHSQKLVAPVEEEGESPIVAFLRLEVYNGIALVQRVHNQLAALSRAIRGTAVLTAHTKTLAASLLQHQVNTVHLLFSDIFYIIVVSVVKNVHSGTVKIRESNKVIVKHLSVKY